jgi:hypothetical protein
MIKLPVTDSAILGRPFSVFVEVDTGEWSDETVITYRKMHRLAKFGACGGVLRLFGLALPIGSRYAKSVPGDRSSRRFSGSKALYQLRGLGALVQGGRANTLSSSCRLRKGSSVQEATSLDGNLSGLDPVDVRFGPLQTRRVTRPLA